MTRLATWFLLCAFVGAQETRSAGRRPTTLGAPAPAVEGTKVLLSATGGGAAAAEPATFGVPFAEETAPTSLDGFVLVDGAGRPQRVQWRALSRYGGTRDAASRPLRFAQFTVLADVADRGRTVYALAKGAPAAGPTIVLTETPAGVTIATAPGTTFQLPREGAALISTATVGGAAALGGPLRLDYAERAGVATPPELEPLVVEESGPLRVVVRRRGKLGALRITVRCAFHAGAADVVCDVRLENPAAYGRFDKTLRDGGVDFRKLDLIVPLPGDGAATPVLLAPPRDGAPRGPIMLRTARVGGGGQDVAATLAVDGQETPYPPAAAGALGAVRGGAAAFVAVERAAELAPKAVALDDAALRVGLFPEGGEPSYRLDGGRWRSQRVVVGFRGGDAAAAAVALDAVAARLVHPLRGGVRPEVARATGAVPTLFAERRAWDDASAARFERFVDLMVDDGAADPFPGKERIGLRRFLERGGTYGKFSAVGWNDFGDLPWADGFCNLHYDWPLHPTLAFLRTADPRFMDAAAPLLAWRRDMGQNHATDEREWWRGANYYEKGARHGDGFPGQASHLWLHGLCLWYALTGDEGAYEAAQQAFDFVLRNAPGDWTGWWGSRIPGWSVHALVDVAAYLGDPRALTEARRGIEKFAEYERSTGGHGCVLNPSDKRTSPWMECIFFLGAARYVAESGDPAPRALLKKQRDWLVAETLRAEPGRVPHSFSHWAPGKPTEPSVHLMWPLIDVLTWSAALGLDASDADRARRLFDATLCHWQAKAGFPLDGDCSPVTFRPAMFPGTETKALGNLLLWGSPHLALRLR
jgi:hypothetical protein